MKTLVVPDIHNHWEQSDQIINAIPHDRLILSGDIFDDFDDGPLEARNTAIWLKKVLLRDNTYAIFGNHDIPYWKPDFSYLDCPGFSREKAHAINSVLTPELWEAKFNLVRFEQGWTISHAGFHPEALPFYPDLLDLENQNITEKYLARACDDALDAILKRRPHPVLENGARMGNPLRGGCFWLDWNEFKPLTGINQIVGHTPHREKVRKKHIVDNKGNITSRNYCIDGAGRFVGMIEDGEFSWFDLVTGKVWKD